MLIDGRWHVNVPVPGTSLLPNLAVRFQKCHLAIFSSFHLGTHTNQYRRTAFFFCPRRQIRAAALEHTMVASPLAHIDAAGGAISKPIALVSSMGHRQHPM